MTVEFLVYAVTTIFTYVLGKISKKKGWNETLPIPMQNIFIIAIVSVIGFVINVEGLDVNSLITAVITAVGGVGTATIVYDTKNQ